MISPVYVREERKDSVEVALPHWLISDAYTGRERETNLRSHLIIKALAIHKTLSIYGVQKAIELEDHKKIPYPRLLQYMERLERRKLIERAEVPAPRNAKMYKVSPGMIGYLYYQHFLKKEEVRQLFQKRLPWLSFFRNFMPQDVDEIIEHHLSEELTAEVVTRTHASRSRVRDLTPRDFKEIEIHLEQSWLSDKVTGLLLEIIRRISRDVRLRNKLKQEIISHPEMVPILLVARAYLKGLMKVIKQTELGLESLSKLLSGFRLSDVKENELQIIPEIRREEFRLLLRKIENSRESGENHIL